jgi:hypothetical protein
MVPVMYSTIDPILRFFFGRWLHRDPGKSLSDVPMHRESAI